MTARLINPEGLASIPLYHQVAIATGDTQIHIAGQVAWDEDGRLVADDLQGQVVQVHRNVAKALAAAGATFHDVVRFTWYVSNWEASGYDSFVAGLEEAARELDLPRSPLSAIGVGYLSQEGILVEAEVTAVLDRSREIPDE